MIIDLRNCGENGGAYGLIAYSEDMKTATKIFAKSHKREQAENVFKSEFDAYKLAQNDKDAAQITPTFFGKAIVERIIARNGCDITSEYYLDLAYKMSYEEGDFIDFGKISEPARTHVRDVFATIGIYYVKDCSVSFNASGDVFKVVDFAIEEFEVWAE